MDQDNKVLYKYWEKPTNTNRVVQKGTAMGENLKTQILTAEMIRRLAITTEGLGEEVYTMIVDKYAQKLINSGYGVDQTRRIVIAGIKGWRSKVDRCLGEGRKVRKKGRSGRNPRRRRKGRG